MNGRKEEERNEKIIRGLLKLPPNRRCINCSSLGPQYVCTNFWTFICITCSGIHREFTHRVKSVSLAKFTSQEVEALQQGGNQRARENLLKDWDMQHQRFPDNNNADKIREFIKNVYVDKKYTGGRSSDKPPRDVQNHRKNDEDSRRASSYHSYSQSPPYEHQYEDRLYGKQNATLTRKPGSDRGYYDGSFFYSPGHTKQEVHEDRFANEGSCPRFSDYSFSVEGAIQRSDSDSPTFQKEKDCSSPVQQVKTTSDKDGKRPTLGTYLEAESKEDVDKIPLPQRATSSGSSESMGSNSVSLKSVNSASLVDVVLEGEQPNRFKHGLESLPSSQSQSSINTNSTDQDLFCLSSVEPSTWTSAHSFNLFAQSDTPPPSAEASTQSTVSVHLAQNDGWATFDVVDNSVSAIETTSAHSNVISSPTDKIYNTTFHALSSAHDSFQESAVQNSIDNKFLGFINDQWNATSRESSTFSFALDPQTWSTFEDYSAVSSTQPVPMWNPFDDFSHFTGSSIEISPASFPSNTTQSSAGGLHESVDSSNGSIIIEEPTKNECRVTTYEGGHVNNISYTEGLPELPVQLHVPPSTGGFHGQILANPFDLPFDSDLEPTEMFPDLSSLQAELPNSQYLNPFASDIGEPWFPQNPAPAFVSSIPSGSFVACMAAEPAVSKLNLPAQGPVASMGGNPFA